MCANAARCSVCAWERGDPLCAVRGPRAWSRLCIQKNLAAAQHGTITMRGDNLIVLNGGFRVSAPPAGSCQVLISHYGR